jgi:hypothetical protein
MYRAQAPYFDGCLISAEGFRKFIAEGEPAYSAVQGLIGRERHFRTTGTPALDRQLDQGLVAITEKFGVRPAFGFYDPSKFTFGAEAWRMNAWASPEDTDIPSSRHTVAFGWDLFHSEFFDIDQSGSTIVAIARSSSRDGSKWTSADSNL